MNIIHTFFKYTEFTTTPGPRVKTTPLQWKFHLESGWMIAAELDPNISDLVWPILLPQPKTCIWFWKFFFSNGEVGQLFEHVARTSFN